MRYRSRYDRPRVPLPITDELLEVIGAIDAGRVVSSRSRLAHDLHACGAAYPNDGRMVLTDRGREALA